MSKINIGESKKLPVSSRVTSFLYSDLYEETCAQIMDKPPIAEYQVGCVISINTGPNMIGILYRT